MQSAYGALAGPEPAEGRGPRVISGDGEMVRLTRERDWSTHPLGPIEGWPDVLLITLNLVLSHTSPKQLFWGKELYHFYNDAAIEFLAERHPAGLGLTAAHNWQEAWETLEPQFRAVMEDGATISQENFLLPVRRNGILLDFYWTYTFRPVHALDGTVVGILDIFKDVTAERERDLLSERLNQVLEDTNDSIMMIDSDWTVTYMNPSAMRVSAPVTDVVGKNLWECYPAFIFEGSPWVENYHRAMDERIACSFEAYYAEPINVWVSTQVQPSKGGITLFFTDVTETKTREAERNRLFQERERFFAVVEEAQDFIGWCDLAGLPLYANPAAHQLLGFESLDAYAGSLTGMFFPEDQRSIVEEFLPAILRDGHAQREVRFRHFKTGEAIWMDYVGFLMRDEHGDPEGYATVSRNLTQQKKTADALIQTEKLAAVGRLASSIAHEINNPLEAVTNLLYLSQETAGLPAEVGRYLTMAEAELKRVSAISSQTLRFHRQSADPAPCHVEELMDGVLAIQRGRIGNARVVVEKRLRAQKAVPCFDGEIRQVFNNLVGNAVDAMSLHGGRLLIRSREGCHWKTGRPGLVVTIADTADGIPAAALGQIFEPFFTTKGMAGTGLGLWVSQEIMARHRGAMRLRSSQGEGHHGSVFTLFLPFRAMERPAA